MTLIRWIHSCYNLVETESTTPPTECQGNDGGCGKPGTWERFEPEAKDMRFFEQAHTKEAIRVSHYLQAFLNKAKLFRLWPHGSEEDILVLQRASRILHEYTMRGGEYGRT